MDKQLFNLGDTVYCLDEDYKYYEMDVKGVNLEHDRKTIYYTTFDFEDIYNNDIDEGRYYFKTSEDRDDYIARLCGIY